MPEWMQVRANKPPTNFDVESYFGRKGLNQAKSVFSFMHTRHNVPTAELANQSNSQASATKVYRIYQWDENVKKQRFDSVPIAKKIGCRY